VGLVLQVFCVFFMTKVRDHRQKLRLIARLLAVSFLLLSTVAHGYSQETELENGASGLPLPRFVSTKSSLVNVRVGPGRNYSVVWNFQKRGLPVEITQEYDNWRKIRDCDGDEGWVYQSLLTGKRTGMVAPWNKDKKILTPLRHEPSSTSTVVAQVEADAIGLIKKCNGDWCEISFDGAKGWMEQTQLWGVYPGEKIK